MREAMSLSASERLQAAAQPEVKPVPSHRKNWFPGQTMLIPTAQQIDDFVRAIPYGQRIDITAMRKQMAAEYKANFTCPVTTGKHIRHVAEVALEALAGGKRPDEITPIWRLVEPTSHAARRLPGGPELIVEQRQREGIA
jgi:hypothetical protein